MDEEYEFNVGWNTESDGYSSVDYSLLPLREIADAKKNTIKALAALDIHPEDIAGYKVTIGSSIVFKPCLLPEGAAIPAMLYALCREIETGVNLSDWQMFAAGRLLGRLALAIRYPKIKEYVLEEFRLEIRGPAWYTQPLIEMCKRIRVMNGSYGASDIFYALDSTPPVHPIGKIERDEDSITITYFDEKSKKLKETKYKDLDLHSFQTFCSNHSDKIGKKRLL